MAGTIFDRTRTPLTVWFAACWHFATGKDGISALSLKRTLEIGSYQTVWAMLHRLRSVLIRPDRELLRGRVEVDETYIGGQESRVCWGSRPREEDPDVYRGRDHRAEGIRPLSYDARGGCLGRSLLAFVSANVEPGTTVITDAWQGYRGLERKGYIHDRRSQRAASARGEDPAALLPGVHRIASLAKRWLLGTHQGAVDSAHLPSYLDEFVFRFNRRRSRSRGMLFYRVLELAVAHGPVRYQDLVLTKAQRPYPPSRRDNAGIRQAWSALRRTALGGGPNSG